MENEIKLLLKSKKKKSKDGKQQFRTFFTDVMILVKGEEDKGPQKKTITVKFADDVKTKDLVRGLITCDEKDIDLPFKYQILKKDDGKDSYPIIYIRAIKNYEERKGKSTIKFITEDEEETEETVIDESELEVEDED